MCLLVHRLLIAIVLVSLYSREVSLENLDDFLQPDDVGERYYFDNCTCTRDCLANTPPKTCYYKFLLEDYSTNSLACGNCPQNVTDCYKPQCITADGVERGMISVNRRLPGPSIQVCMGDRIVVDVINKMLAKSTTIHWHGIFQKGTPHMDGVPMITQCPIVEDTSFRYDFSVTQAGTYYWHSHEGVLKVDGLQGSMVIRRPKEDDPNGDLYDYDMPAHVIFLMDWLHTGSSQQFPGLLHPNPVTYSTRYLINGKGRFWNPSTGNTTNTPYSVFQVSPGKRYRFRLIGATCFHCPLRFCVQGHNLTIISVDANSVKPVVVDCLIISTGERFDFVLNAASEVKSYWINAVGLGECEKAYQQAILKYEGSCNLEPPRQALKDILTEPKGTVLNHPNATCKQDRRMCISQLEANENFDPRILHSEPDVCFTMYYGYYFPTIEEIFYNNTYHRYFVPGSQSLDVMYVNNIFMEHPSSPILSQRSDIDQSAYCPQGPDGFPACSENLCSCFHVMKCPLGKLVQIILIDESSKGEINHPFHLHGYAFYVMSMGHMKNGSHTADKITILMKNNSLIQSPCPVMKDTITVQSRGYSVIKFVADNPGYWLFHCHFLRHHVSGMALLVQVGEPDEMPPVPEDFPKCRNYLPPLK